LGLSAVAGVDIGASGIRVIVDANGELARHQRTVALPLDEGEIDQPALTELIERELMHAARKVAVSSFGRIAIGLAGFPDRLDDPDRLARLIHRSVSVESIIVAGDVVTTHVGALGRQEGTVIAVGTGAVALATDFDTVWQRADGWGLLLGDEGGGAWIGMAGLKAALRAYDGRADGSQTLLESMRAAFGEPRSLVEHVYRHGAPASRLASFAPEVANAARAGDTVAAGILRDATLRLAETVSAAASAVEPLISWGGRLFDAGEIVLEPFKEAVRSRVPGACLVDPNGSSVDGALLLARRSGDAPVQSHEPHIYVFDRLDLAGEEDR
jgi:N-acetylglucosamine kinase-like BadF-type ATPase